VNYLFSRSVTGVMVILSEPIARNLGRFCGYLASYVCRGRMQMAARHMNRVLGTDTDLRQAAREVFANYGRYWAEIFWIRSHGVKEVDRHITVDGIEQLRKARDAGRGMILAFPHLGNWDMAGPVALREQIPLTAVVQAPRQRRAREYVVELQQKLGIEVVFAEESGISTSALVKRLRAGGAVALLSDRDLTGTGVPVQFFDEETNLPAGPATLAQLTGAPIFPMAVYFQPGCGHRTVVYPPLEPATTGSLEQRLRIRTQRLAHALEAMVREAPTQWHLLRPNWPSDRNGTGPV